MDLDIGVNVGLDAPLTLTAAKRYVDIDSHLDLDFDPCRWDPCRQVTALQRTATTGQVVALVPRCAWQRLVTVIRDDPWQSEYPRGFIEY